MGLASSSAMAIEPKKESRASFILSMTAADLIRIENRLVEHWRNGDVNGLTHFQGSEDGSYEEWLADFFRTHVRPQDWIFASHRAHMHALLAGMPEEELVQRVLSGHSMALYTPRLVTSAIVAGSCGIAAGRALAAQQSGEDVRVFCFIGDGGEEEGAFAEAVQFSWNRDLPILFIIEDNNGSCGVTQEQRQTTKRFSWPESHVLRVRYCLKWPHAGDGSRPSLKSLTPSRRS